MMVSEERTDSQATGQASQRRVVLMIGGVAVILIALVGGLSSGKSAAPEESDPTLTGREMFAEGREEALADVKKTTAKEGFQEGRRQGLKQGGRAGRRAGLSDGATAVQQQLTDTAASAAETAQSELSAIASSPVPP